MTANEAQTAIVSRKKSRASNLIVTAESEVKHKTLHRNFEKRELENIFLENAPGK